MLLFCKYILPSSLFLLKKKKYMHLYADRGQYTHAQTRTLARDKVFSMYTPHLKQSKQFKLVTMQSKHLNFS